MNLRIHVARVLVIVWALGCLPRTETAAQAGILKFFFGSKAAPAGESRGQTGTEITALNLDDGTNIDVMVEEARRLIAESRANNPALGAIEIPVILNSPSGPPGDQGDAESIELARLIQTTDHNARAFKIQPTEHFAKHLTNIPDKQNPLYSSQANQRLRKMRLTVVALRSIYAGTIMSTVLLVSNGIPLQAAIAGGVGAALMSGELMRLDDYMNARLEARPFWDKNGVLTDHSGKPLFRMLNVATSYARHTGIIAGYVVMVHWMSVAFGGPADHYESPSWWMLHKVGLAAMSAVTIGQWKQLQRTVFNRAMLANSIENYADVESGINRSQKIKVVSWLTAMVTSAVAVSLDAMGLGHSTKEVVPYIMVGVGAVGGAAMVWECTDFKGFFRKQMQTLRSTFEKSREENRPVDLAVESAGLSTQCAAGFQRRS